MMQAVSRYLDAEWSRSMESSWSKNSSSRSMRLPRDTRENAPSGWFGPGDPKHSSQKIGQRAIKLSVSYIRDFVEEFRRFPLGPRK